MNLLLQSFLTTMADVWPIIVIIFGFQILVIRKPIHNLKRVLIGFFYVLLGLTLFLEGLELALFPLGRLMASQLTDPAFLFDGAKVMIDSVNWVDYYWVYIFAFAIGFSTTVAEPSLIAVAMKAEDVSGGAISVWGLRFAVAIGVSIGVALGAFRIITGTPLHYYIIGAYIVVVIQTFYAPRMIIPLAYDSGGVTSSTVTVPLVAALGLGLAESVPGRNPLIDGFGLIAFAVLFPIMTVMGYAQLSEFRAHRQARQRESAEAVKEADEKTGEALSEELEND